MISNDGGLPKNYGKSVSVGVCVTSSDPDELYVLLSSLEYGQFLLPIVDSLRVQVDDVVLVDN